MTGSRRTVVFVGPSLRPAEVTTLLPDAVLRPPARRGDFDALSAAEVAEVILIDGVMVYEHPPSPAETHRLVSRGIRVIGASSLGALRAVELQGLGVQGVGWVFEQVRDRHVTADDELVARLDPRTDQAETVFLVNLRYAAAALVRSGAITEQQVAALLSSVGELYFEARLPQAVIGIARSHGWSPETAGRVLDEEFDIKAQDARQALKASQRDPGSDAGHQDRIGVPA